MTSHATALQNTKRDPAKSRIGGRDLEERGINIKKHALPKGKNNWQSIPNQLANCRQVCPSRPFQEVLEGIQVSTEVK